MTSRKRKGQSQEAYQPRDIINIPYILKYLDGTKIIIVKENVINDKICGSYKKCSCCRIINAWDDFTAKKIYGDKYRTIGYFDMKGNPPSNLRTLCG